MADTVAELHMLAKGRAWVPEAYLFALSAKRRDPAAAYDLMVATLVAEGWRYDDKLDCWVR